jgi:hypothetical protein
MSSAPRNVFTILSIKKEFRDVYGSYKEVCKGFGFMAERTEERFAGVSLRWVNRIVEEAPVIHVDDAAEREKRRIGRPSKVQGFRNLLVEFLEEKPDLTSLRYARGSRPHS